MRRASVHVPRGRLSKISPGLVGILLALTYPGWILVCLDLPHLLPDWAASVLFENGSIGNASVWGLAAAAIPPAIVIGGVACATTLFPRSWLMKVVGSLVVIQAVLLRCSSWWKMDSAVDVTVVGVPIVIAAATLCSVYVWHRTATSRA